MTCSWTDFPEILTNETKATEQEAPKWKKPHWWLMQFTHNTRVLFLMISFTEEASTWELKGNIGVKSLIWLQMMNFNVILLLIHLSNKESKAGEYELSWQHSSHSLKAPQQQSQPGLYNAAMTLWDAISKGVSCWTQLTFATAFIDMLQPQVGVFISQLFHLNMKCLWARCFPSHVSWFAHVWRKCGLY